MSHNWRRAGANNAFRGRGFSSYKPSYRRNEVYEGNNWQSKYQRHIQVRNLIDQIDPDFFRPKIQDEYFEAVNQRDISPLMTIINYDGILNESNYVAALKMLLKLEQAHQEVEMRRYDKMSDRLVCANPKIDIEGDEEKDQPEKDKDTKRAPSSMFGIELIGQADSQLIDISSPVLIEPVGGYPAPSIKRIKEFIGDVIVLNDLDDLRERNVRVNVYFLCSRSTNVACTRALGELESNSDMREIIFKQNGSIELDEESLELGILPEDLVEARQELEPKIKLDELDLVVSEADRRLKNAAKLNPMQRQAIKCILEAKCRPKPYILFGPPGTGKTHTLVETVAQIHLRSPSSKVLFCANSNTCVDQTYDKINETGVFEDGQVLRLHSGEFIRDEKQLEKARVVVTTNTKSGSLLSMKGRYRFDYVIVDEAGHAHEAESLIPISTLEYRGCLVLAGDPKQLGPVVQFELAGQKGLEKSMLDRIIQWDIYKRQELSDKYDSRYLTKLVDCYRCDPRVLEMSNKLFYESSLHCLHQTPRSMLSIMRLTSPVQVLFCMDGEEIQPRNSTSWENRVEINECVGIVSRLYKMGLAADQIGIMSPYRKQVKEMRKKLKETLLGGLASLLDDRFAIKYKKVKMVPKDEAARDASRRNEEKLRRRKIIDGLDEILEEVEMVREVEWITTKQNWICKVDTVDSFQGNERDVVIFSPVRTSCRRRLGFLDDARRFNVAMSRAKSLLIVVGNPTVLNASEFWKEFLCNAKEDVKNWPRQSIFDNPHSQARALFRKN